MDAEILTPTLFGEHKDPAQKVSGQRRMIEVAAVRVGPFEPVFIQDLGEPVKENGVVSADGVIGGRELERHRDERERDNEYRVQIASGGHGCDSSSFNAL